MNILLTGATGYIGRRLLPVLVQAGHHVTCVVRNPLRFDLPENLRENTTVVQADVLDAESLNGLPSNIDVAYYLVHSMSHSSHQFEQMEARAAQNFTRWASTGKCRQIIYLSGLVNDEQLSPHLQSRYNVEKILRDGSVPVTVLRAAIIIGSGSASFEIIRDLVEKLPLMVAPKWVNNRCQPIAVRDVIFYLTNAINRPDCLDQSFDIGGPDVLTYREMLLGLAKVRGLRRYIILVPVLTPRLSSYWLYFVTSTSFSLARHLVDSLKNEAVCSETRIRDIIPYTCSDYQTSLRRAFARIEDNAVISSWKDAWVSGVLEKTPGEYINAPTHGCFVDSRDMQTGGSEEDVLNNIWNIGGDTGWYHMNLLWEIRGFLDKLAGGVGLRRGRTNQKTLHAGDALDFWRVLYANRDEGRLLLYAEMKLPGEAWLEFRLANGVLRQTATFRPNGLSGRLYWYAVLPFHHLIFHGMLKKIANRR